MSDLRNCWYMASFIDELDDGGSMAGFLLGLSPSELNEPAGKAAARGALQVGGSAVSAKVARFDPAGPSPLQLVTIAAMAEAGPLDCSRASSRFLPPGLPPSWGYVPIAAIPGRLPTP
jgi:hypothetical protein